MKVSNLVLAILALSITQAQSFAGDKNTPEIGYPFGMGYGVGYGMMGGGIGMMAGLPDSGKVSPTNLQLEELKLQNCQIMQPLLWKHYGFLMDRTAQFESKDGQKPKMPIELERELAEGGKALSDNAKCIVDQTQRITDLKNTLKASAAATQQTLRGTQDIGLARGSDSSTAGGSKTGAAADAGK